MPEIQRAHRGAVVIDDRYAPIIITTFLGETNLELGHWFAETHKKILLSHAALGRRVVTINDATWAQKPSPEMRRFWAEMADRSSESMKAATLATFLVVNSPLLRGAITAIGWLTPALRDLESYASVDDAIREGMARLLRADLPTPKLTGSYQLPETAQKARSAFAR